MKDNPPSVEEERLAFEVLLQHLPVKRRGYMGKSCTACRYSWPCPHVIEAREIAAETDLIDQLQIREVIGGSPGSDRTAIIARAIIDSP